MVARKFLLLAMAACIQATPVATAPEATTTDWTALTIPEDAINMDGIDKDALLNPANWNQEPAPEEMVEDVSSNPANSVLTKRGGACQQGDCPDYKAGFDLVYTFSAVPVTGNPGLNIFSSNSDIRVKDCDKCLRKKVGSSLGEKVAGGCYDFKACNRQQTICVDPGKRRAHRVWKDNGKKKCYKMKVEYLGSCGAIKSRIVVHPSGETACNW